MNEKKYRIIIENYEEDNTIYEIYFEDILSLDKFYFGGNRDFGEHEPTWYEDVEQLWNDTENYIEFYWDYRKGLDFADILKGANECVEDYSEKMKKHGITLTASKVLSIYEYSFGFGDYKDSVKSKLYFDEITDNHRTETLDVADFLAGLNGGCIRGCMQSDWIYCYYLNTDSDAGKVYDEDYFSCLYFGGLYTYDVVEVDSLEVDINDIDLSENIDSITTTWNSDPTQLFNYKIDGVAKVEGTRTYTVTKNTYKIETA